MKMDEPGLNALRAWREKVVLEHVDAENAKDLKRVMDTFATPCYDLAAAGAGSVEGDEAVRALQGRNWAAFPGVRYEAVRLHHCEAGVILEYRIRGRHEGTYLGIPPTGSPIDVAAIAMFEFAGRDLVCERPYVNQALLLAQMQGNPPPVSGRIPGELP
jgi:predicted ester cyclase